MASIVIASSPLSFLSSRRKSVGVLVGNYSLRRHSLLCVGCRTNNRLVSASAVFQPGYFSSLGFPVRIFKRPPSSSCSVVVIAFLVSSVFAALAFLFRSARERRILERKIISYHRSGVPLRLDHPAAVSGESPLGVCGARMGFSNEEMLEEKVTHSCDSIGWPTRNSVIYSLINASNTSGRGLEPRGLGFRDSLMFSFPFQKTSGSEFGQGVNCIVSGDAETYGPGNAGNNGVSERLCDDRERAGNDNQAETDIRLINDGMEQSEEVDGKISERVSSVTKLDVDYIADEISDQFIDDGMEENDMVAQVSGELLTSLCEESKMVYSNSEIDGEDITKETELQIIDDEKEKRNRPLVDDERERNEEFTKACDESIVSLHEESEFTIGGETEGNILKQNLPQTMEGETKMRDSVTEASSESTGYHNEEDVHESMAVPVHSSRNPMPVFPFSSDFVVESHMRDSTTDEQDEISDEEALQGAMPAIAMGAGILGMLTAGGRSGGMTSQKSQIGKS